jgi:DNA polymerase III delta prime subunit
MSSILYSIMELVGNVQLVAGDSQAIDPILALLKKDGIETVGNPDLYIREYASFGVDEARELAQKASTRAVASSRRIFVIVAPGMTAEAQNALLKTFEEPSADALFFVVVPSPHMVLPTLRSRAQILTVDSAAPNATVDPKVFLKEKPEKRLEMLKPLLDKDEDDKRDLSASILFLSALERELSQNLPSNKESIEAVYRARKYIGDKGSLSKALLEQVALLI